MPPSRTRTLLGELIDATPWIDTHEHLIEERHRLGEETYHAPDAANFPFAVLADWTALLNFYARADLVSAGMPPRVGAFVFDDDRPGPREKWDAVAPYIQAVRHTGYLRAVDLTTERLFGLRLSRETCVEIDEAARTLRRPGYYAHVLRDRANVDHCHVNSLEIDPYCETDTPELLKQDLSIFALVTGEHPGIEAASGIEVDGLDDYVRVIEWCFARYGEHAVAVKSQWAYVRSLAVEIGGDPPRSEFDRLRKGTASADERRRVEDYLFCRCLDLAQEWDLPVKLHLGYLAGNAEPELRHVFHDPYDVTPMLQAYPGVTFVLMHIAWPQQEQLLALAKHLPNVVVDLCWAWILAPLATAEFVQRFVTAVPYTKLLCFGGDYALVENVVGHAELARRGLQTALESLVEGGWMTRDDAAALVPDLMRGNAERVFARERPA
jgi:predicted TIM-barrel fold metal-dependent hydrolase